MLTKQLKIQPLNTDIKLPSRATANSGGFDIYAQEDIILISGDSPSIIKLGFKTQLPENTDALVLPRSGFGTKFGMNLSNTVGLIDNDYRGEWMAVVSVDARRGTKPISKKPYDLLQFDPRDYVFNSADMEKIWEDYGVLVIKKGMALAQFILIERTPCDVIIVDKVNDTERGDGGFGSTT